MFGVVCVRDRQQPREGHSARTVTTHFHRPSEIIMQPSLIRRQLGGIVPPKVASPTLLVRFYKENLSLGELQDN